MAMWREWRGDGDPAAPAAVFLHGWPADHRGEAAAYDAAFAARGYARLYCDLPGMGNSAEAAIPADLDGYVGAILRMVRAELGERPFVLCGTSAGAYLARGVVARTGSHIRGLILRVPLVEPDDARRDLDPPSALTRDPAAMAAMPPAVLASLEGMPALVESAAWIEAFAARKRDLSTPARDAADHAALDPIRFDPARYTIAGAGDWPVFDGPALIMAGRQDAVVGWRDALAAFAHWPRATLAVLDMVGHAFPLAFQQPLVDALVADFLQRLEMAP